jgi:hypothetical protein
MSFGFYLDQMEQRLLNATRYMEESREKGIPGSALSILSRVECIVSGATNGKSLRRKGLVVVGNKVRFTAYAFSLAF